MTLELLLLQILLREGILVSRPNTTLFRVRLAVIAMLTAICIVLMFLPWQSGYGLDKYHAIFARGEYEVSIDELTKLLLRYPDWHDARALLLQSALAAGDPLTALENLLYLMEADRASQYEANVLSWLAANEDAQEQSRVYLMDKLKTQPQRNSVRILLVQLETQTKNPDSALTHLIELGLRGAASRTLEKKVAKMCSDRAPLERLNQVFLETQNPWAREMMLLIALEQHDFVLAKEILRQFMGKNGPPGDLALQTWFLALREDLVRALDLAVLLGENEWIQRVLLSAENISAFQLKQILPGMLDIMPEEPRLLALEAFIASDPRVSLSLLKELEASGYIPEDQDYYGSRKLALLQDLGDFNPAYLDNIPDVLILNMALEQRGNPALASVLADWLEQKSPGMGRDVALLRQIIASETEPALVWSGLDFPQYFSPGLSFSSDGRMLLASDPSYNSVVVVNLDSGVRMGFPAETSEWHWQSENTVVTLGRGSRSPKISQLDSSQTTSLTIDLPDKNSIVYTLGRLDNDTLLLESTWQTMSRIGKLNIETGHCTWLEPRKGQPMLTSGKKVAWIWPEDGKLFIDMGDGAKSYAVDQAEPLEWYDNDRKLLLNSQGDTYSLDLESGNLYPTPLPPLYSPGNWASETRTWGFFPFSKSKSSSLVYYSLFITDIETGLQEYAGLTIQAASISYCAQGNLVAITNDSGKIFVYEIPVN